MLSMKVIRYMKGCLVLGVFMVITVYMSMKRLGTMHVRVHPRELEDLLVETPPKSPPLLAYNYNHDCRSDPDHQTQWNVHNFKICGNTMDSDRKYTRNALVLSTSMYYNVEKVFIYNNTLYNWARYSPQLQPVLFLTEDGLLTHHADMIQNACNMGWAVFMAPRCNNLTYPVLPDMVLYSQMVFPQAQWYGYANGDILFDKGLVESLDFLNRLRQTENITTNMVVGQHYHIYLQPGEHVSHPKDFVTRFTADDVGDNFALDYFISQADQYDWGRVPPFVIGRPIFDNWLVEWGYLSVSSKMAALQLERLHGFDIYDAVHPNIEAVNNGKLLKKSKLTRDRQLWDALKNGRFVVDATESILATHQGIAGETEDYNSYWSREEGVDYNRKLLLQLSTEPVLKNATQGGRTTCISNALVNVNTSPFLNLPIKPVLPRNYRFLTTTTKMQFAAKMLLKYDFWGKSVEKAMIEANTGRITLRDDLGDEFLIFYLDKYGRLSSPIIKDFTDRKTALASINVASDVPTKVFRKYYMKKSRIMLFERYNHGTYCSKLDDPRVIPVKLKFRV